MQQHLTEGMKFNIQILISVRLPIQKRIDPTKLIYAEFLYLKKKNYMHISIQIIVDKFLMVLNI